MRKPPASGVASKKNRPPPPPVSQSITATPLMYLGHKKWFTGAGAGLRNPARWIEGQAVGGQHPLPPGKSPPGYRGGGSGWITEAATAAGVGERPLQLCPADVRGYFVKKKIKKNYIILSYIRVCMLRPRTAHR